MFKSRIHVLLFRRPLQRRTFSAAPSSGHGPLNILFCGSDKFSLESLRTLLQLKSTGVVQQLDVLTKLEKGSGRGKKESRLIPTMEFAAENGLRTCQITSFEDWKAGVTGGVPRGWEPPPKYDLIVAVSFGFFIPKSVLESTTYGGLNVHPSLLPKYRGAAPLQHAILSKDTTTGVTVQTLHPRKFDHGTILLQSPEIPLDYTTHPFSTGIYGANLEILAKAGADLLERVLQEGLYIEPEKHAISPKYTPSMASKLGLTEIGSITFGTDTASDVFHKAIAMGKVFCHRRDAQSKRPHRTQFIGVRLVNSDDRTPVDPIVGDFGLVESREEMWLGVSPGEVIIVEKVQRAGKKLMPAGQWFRGTKAGKTGEGRYFFFTKPVIVEVSEGVSVKDAQQELQSAWDHDYDSASRM